MTILFDEIQEKISTQQFNEAADSLLKIPVLKLTAVQLSEADELFSQLPPDISYGSADICYAILMIKRQRKEPSAAADWLSRLTALRAANPGDALIKNRLSCALLGFTPGTNHSLLLKLSQIAHVCKEGRIHSAPLSSTGKSPSVLRGAEDLSDLGLYYQASVDLIKPVLPFVFEDNASGVCEAAISEILYEHNDLTGAESQSKTAANAVNPEIAFAGLALQARAGAAVNNPSFRNLLKSINERLSQSEAGWLVPHEQALSVWFALLDGDNEAAGSWANGGDLPQTVYAGIVKAKVRLALGGYHQVLETVNALLPGLQRSGRVLDTIECQALAALAYTSLGNRGEALYYLEQAAAVAQSYGYIRVLADFGRVFADLISTCWPESFPSGIRKGFVNKVTEVAKIYSSYHPRLFENVVLVSKVSNAAEPAAEPNVFDDTPVLSEEDASGAAGAADDAGADIEADITPASSASHPAAKGKGKKSAHKENAGG